MPSTPAALQQHVRSFVAPFVLRPLTSATSDAAALDSPRAERLEASVLFADISGFTPLAESLARRGPEGAEVLTRLLNDYLGQLVEMVVAHGGEVLSFAGDAVIAVWPTLPTESQRESLSRCV